MECVIDGVTLSPLVDMVLGGAEVAIEGETIGLVDGVGWTALLPLCCL